MFFMRNRFFSYFPGPFRDRSPGAQPVRGGLKGEVPPPVRSHRKVKKEKLNLFMG